MDLKQNTQGTARSAPQRPTPSPGGGALPLLPPRWASDPQRGSQGAYCVWTQCRSVGLYGGLLAAGSEGSCGEGPPCDLHWAPCVGLQGTVLTADGIKNLTAAPLWERGGEQQLSVLFSPTSPEDQRQTGRKWVQRNGLATRIPLHTHSQVHTLTGAHPPTFLPSISLCLSHVPPALSSPSAALPLPPQRACAHPFSHTRICAVYLSLCRHARVCRHLYTHSTLDSNVPRRHAEQGREALPIACVCTGLDPLGLCRRPP